jgi:hypothetical protein
MEHAMKKLIAVAFAAASIIAGPAALITTASPAFASCADGDVPEAWKRPGGFCEQSSGKGSLSDEGDGCDGEAIYKLLSAPLMQEGDRVIVAVAVDPCYSNPPCAKAISSPLMDPTVRLEYVIC